VTTRFHSAGQLPLVMVDVLQIEQVILNLMRNSIDAIKNSGANNGSIVVEAKLVSDEFIEVGLFDTGPGFTREQIESGFLPCPPQNPTVLASDCHCASRSLRYTAVDCGWMRILVGRRSALLCPSQ
jgi:hypothetical protein